MFEKRKNKLQEGSVILPIIVVVLIIAVIVLLIYRFINSHLELSYRQNKKINDKYSDISYQEELSNEETKEENTTKYDEDITIEEAKGPTNISSWNMERVEHEVYYKNEAEDTFDRSVVKGTLLQTQVADIGNLLYSFRLEDIFIVDKGWKRTLSAGSPLGKSDGYLGKLGENKYRYIEYSSVYEEGIQANYTSKIFYSDIFILENN
jgi:hypothetical protein